MGDVESRLSVIESQWSEAMPILKDLHVDMLERRGRQKFYSVATKYFLWVVAGLMSMVGLSKTDAVATWLGKFPQH